MIVAADDMCDTKIRIVHNDGEMIGRVAVRAHDHEIVELAVIEDDPAVY